MRSYGKIIGSALTGERIGSVLSSQVTFLRKSWHQRLIASHVIGERIHAIVLSVFVLTTLMGCSVMSDVLRIEDVKPWQRGILARDDMQLTTDAMQQSVDDHIYFSKEASTGGSSVKGGGCGCN